jgi:type IV pili sensor histidine kinase/response regulator
MRYWAGCLVVWAMPALAGFSLIDEESPDVELPAHSVKATSRAEAKPLAVQERWTASEGMTLREAVAAWAKQANWSVQWVAEDVDYPILGTLSYIGSFENAVTGIFQAHQKVERPLKVRGNSQQRVIIVTEQS